MKAFNFTVYTGTSQSIEQVKYFKYLSIFSHCFTKHGKHQNHIMQNAQKKFHFTSEP